MLTFQTAEGQFNYRVAGIAIRDGCVLLHKDVRDNFWVLPGGRVEFMETAAAALRRELMEETGVVADVGRLVWIVENFFEYQQRRFHEIGLYFVMTIAAGTVTESNFRGQEGAADLEFWWCPLKELQTIDLQPRFLITRLLSLPHEIEHLVQLT
jgi:8-oxo-dGTP pyrophosphatase MutT (NUDIX family)